MKILLCCCTGLGNAILKTPMIQYLNEMQPDVELHLLDDNNQFTTLIEKKDLIYQAWHMHDPVFSHSMPLFEELKQQHFDVMLLPWDSQYRYTLLKASNVIAAKKTIVQKIPFKSMNARLKNIVEPLKYRHAVYIPTRKNIHETILNTDLLRPLGIKEPTTLKRTYVNHHDDVAPKDIKTPYIVLQMSSANGVNTVKNWPLTYFESLIYRILKNTDHNIVLVGGKRDLAILRNHLHADKPRVFNRVGETSLQQVMSILKRADCVISNDSGIMHITDAMDVPLIAMYGPTDRTRTQPLGEKSTVLVSQNDTTAAMANFKYSDNFLYQRYGLLHCMESLKISTVYATLLDKIGHTREAV